MKWNELKTIVLYENHWQEIKVDTVQTEHSEPFDYCYVSKKHNSAVILAVNEKQELALLKIYRYPIKQVIWQVPVEVVESGEEDLHGAIRGCKEELQFYPEKIEKIGEFFIDPGTVSQIAKVYLCSDLEVLHNSVDEEINEKDSIENISWLSLGKIEEMIASGEIMDGWTLSAVSIYKNFLAKNNAQ